MLGQGGLPVCRRQSQPQRPAPSPEPLRGSVFLYVAGLEQRAQHWTMRAWKSAQLYQPGQQPPPLLRKEKANFLLRSSPTPFLASAASDRHVSLMRVDNATRDLSPEPC